MDNETTNQQISGKLFDVMVYNSQETLNNFIDQLNKEQANQIIVHAVRSAHSRGVFSLEESELVSKSLRLLLSPPKIME
jgi:hypothetical protein